MVVAENRLNQSFEVESVNRVWVGDITFISTAAGLALSLGIVGFLFPTCGRLGYERTTRSAACHQGIADGDPSLPAGTGTDPSY